MFFAGKAFLMLLSGKHWVNGFLFDGLGIGAFDFLCFGIEKHFSGRKQLCKQSYSLMGLCYCCNKKNWKDKIFWFM